MGVSLHQGWIHSSPSFPDDSRLYQVEGISLAWKISAQSISLDLVNFLSKSSQTITEPGTWAIVFFPSDRMAFTRSCFPVPQTGIKGQYESPSSEHLALTCIEPWGSLSTTSLPQYSLQPVSQAHWGMGRYAEVSVHSVFRDRWWAPGFLPSGGVQPHLFITVHLKHMKLSYTPMIWKELGTLTPEPHNKYISRFPSLSHRLVGLHWVLGISEPNLTLCTWL